MNRKGIIGLVIVITVIIIVAVVFAIYKNIKREENNLDVENKDIELPTDVLENNIVEEEGKNSESIKSESNILVVYYSAQTHTKAVAKKIAENINADIFEIVPEQIYTSEDLNWTNSNSRVSREHEDESLRNIKLVTTKVDNWEKYDTVLIGYPIWWGIAAWPVDNFVKENDFSGKTVIPFCTSTSSGLGNSGELLKEYANSGNWSEGQRFRSNASDSDIRNWTDSLK